MSEKLFEDYCMFITEEGDVAAYVTGGANVVGVRRTRRVNLSTGRRSVKVDGGYANGPAGRNTGADTISTFYGVPTAKVAAAFMSGVNGGVCPTHDVLAHAHAMGVAYKAGKDGLPSRPFHGAAWQSWKAGRNTRPYWWME